MGNSTFEGYVIIETPKAIQFHGHYWDEPIWMPKSQITMWPDPGGYEIIIVASEWICDKKSVREFERVEASV